MSVVMSTSTDVGNQQEKLAENAVYNESLSVDEKNVSSSTDPQNSGDSTNSGPRKNELSPSQVVYEDGKCYYTDPDSGTKLEWNEASKQWTPVEDASKNYELIDGCYYYKDLTGIRHKWDSGTNGWIQVPNDDDSEEDDNDDDDVELTQKKRKNVVRQDMSDGIYGLDGDKRTYTDPKDGTVYVWDNTKNAWFPKVDDDFLAQYQMSYGFTDPEQPTEDKVVPPQTALQPETPAEQPTLKRKASEPTWFDVDEKNNTKVYVSNLPLDTTDQEFVDLMQKCGLVMKDLDTGKMKIKLYTERDSDILKGDGLCTYIKVESVQLALNLLDGYDFKGKKIKVERAKFTMKGSSYNPSLKPKKKKKKALEKMKKIQEKLFDWRPDKIRGEREKHERVVIIKNLFEPSTFDKDPSLILEYQQDLREEAVKCGDIRKVIVHDRHPEGVGQIFFKEAEAADACVQLLNGRWFGQRKIQVSTWDGKAKYRIFETEEEIEARIRKWDSYLEAEEEEEDDGKCVDKTSKKGDDSGIDAKTITTENVETKSDKGADSDGTRSSAGSDDDSE